MPHVLSATDAADRIRAGGDDVILLDCREPEELAIASIDGALAIPMGEIPSRLPELDPEKEYIVVCHHGIRSAQVCAFLASNDFDRVINLAGGIEAWSRDVDASVPRY